MINRNEVLKKTKGRCAYCGIELTGKFQVDHVIAKFNFHKYSHKLDYKVNDIQNLLAACCSCNNYKHSFTIEQFRNELQQLQIRLHKHNSTYRIAKRFNLIKENENKIIFYFEEAEHE